MTFLNLYLIFFKIGCFAFGGGYATIPLIEKYIVIENSYLSVTEFKDLISISQMTPGPIAINSATFVGQKIGDFPGAIIATFGLMTPQLILSLILGYFLFTLNKRFILIDYMLNGIKIGIISLIFISTISLINISIFRTNFNINYTALITFIFSFILYLKKISLINLIILGALMGIFTHFLMIFLF